jgi:predicted ATPase/DNA-binding CsgD family transcriptional regulator
MPIATGPLMPAQPTPLVDRTDELATICQCLADDGTRLLTLTGPTGVGKTRLALAAAAQLANHFRDGAILVDLSLVRDPQLVLSSIARAVGLLDIDTGSRNLLERLQDALEERQILLVLDNFEQVLAAATFLASLLATCLNLRMLVTSRAPLQLRWERTLRITPLPVPDLAMPLPPLDELAAIPSIALFLQWARTRQADFVLTENQAPLVAHLVVQLDGLPLALELAAARTATLSLPAMASRLGGRLHLLHWEAVDVPERQQSLEAAVGWSYDLLSEPERRFFRCLGVFVGRVALDAISAVYGEVAGEAGAGGGDGDRTLDRLLSLAEQSLIQPVPPTDQGWQQEKFGQHEWVHDEKADDEAEPAFGMLETMREYAEERLAAAGELDTAHRAHAAYFLSFAEQADPQLRGPAQRMWLLRLDREFDNLRTALRWLLDQETPADRMAALRLAGALGYFWQLRGYHVEGRRWLEEALSRAPRVEQGERPDSGSAAVRTRALLPAGLLRASFGELDQAQAHLEEALALARQRQDSASIVQALVYLGASPLFAGQAPAIRLLEAALHYARVLGEPEQVGITLFYLAVALRTQGHVSAASAHFIEALDQLEAAGDTRMAGAVHIHLGALLGQQGDPSSALQHLRAGLATSVRMRSRWLLGHGAWAVLALLGDRADPGTCARLLGATAVLRQAMGVGGAAWEHMAAGPEEPALRARLAREEWAAYREGGTLPAGEVAALALQVLDEFDWKLSPPASTSAGATMSHHVGHAQAQTTRHDDESQGEHLLSEREREVLRLVEQGLSNKAVGQQLFISSRTVSQHLTSVFNKLGVNTRTQAVAVAAHRGLI